MRTARWWGGPEVNKFKQVSSDDQKISLVRVWYLLEGTPYYVTFPMTHVVLPSFPNGQTDTCENITFTKANSL